VRDGVRSVLRLGVGVLRGVDRGAGDGLEGATGTGEGEEKEPLRTRPPVLPLPLLGVLEELPLELPEELELEPDRLRVELPLELPEELELEPDRLRVELPLELPEELEPRDRLPEELPLDRDRDGRENEPPRLRPPLRRASAT